MQVLSQSSLYTTVLYTVYYICIMYIHITLGAQNQILNLEHKNNRYYWIYIVSYILLENTSSFDYLLCYSRMNIYQYNLKPDNPFQK
jgi:hypothetical protein